MITIGKKIISKFEIICFYISLSKEQNVEISGVNLIQIWYSKIIWLSLAKEIHKNDIFDAFLDGRANKSKQNRTKINATRSVLLDISVVIT